MTPCLCKSKDCSHTVKLYLKQEAKQSQERGIKFKGQPEQNKKIPYMF